jgi:membrane protein YqaA with SNARE-associated domain
MVFWQLIVLFCVGAFGLWMAIPVGLAYGFNPVVIAITIILGSATSTTLVYIFGSKLRKYITSRRGERYLGRSKAKMYHYLNRYGVIGLGLLLPGVFGPALGMAIGITIVSNTKRLWLWTLAGNVLWSIIMASIGALGITIF